MISLNNSKGTVLYNYEWAYKGKALTGKQFRAMVFLREASLTISGLTTLENTSYYRKTLRQFYYRKTLRKFPHSQPAKETLLLTF